MEYRGVKILLLSTVFLLLGGGYFILFQTDMPIKYLRYTLRRDHQILIEHFSGSLTKGVRISKVTGKVSGVPFTLENLNFRYSFKLNSDFSFTVVTDLLNIEKVTLKNIDQKLSVNKISDQTNKALFGFDSIKRSSLQRNIHIDINKVKINKVRLLSKGKPPKELDTVVVSYFSFGMGKISLGELSMHSHAVNLRVWTDGPSSLNNIKLLFEGSLYPDAHEVLAHESTFEGDLTLKGDDLLANSYFFDQSLKISLKDQIYNFQLEDFQPENYFSRDFPIDSLNLNAKYYDLGDGPEIFINAGDFKINDREFKISKGLIKEDPDLGFKILGKTLNGPQIMDFHIYKNKNFKGDYLLDKVPPFLITLYHNSEMTNDQILAAIYSEEYDFNKIPQKYLDKMFSLRPFYIVEKTQYIRREVANIPGEKQEGNEAPQESTRLGVCLVKFVHLESDTEKDLSDDLGVSTLCQCHKKVGGLLGLSPFANRKPIITWDGEFYAVYDQLTERLADKCQE